MGLLLFISLRLAFVLLLARVEGLEQQPQLPMVDTLVGLHAPTTEARELPLELLVARDHGTDGGEDLLAPRVIETLQAIEQPNEDSEY